MSVAKAKRLKILLIVPMLGMVMIGSFVLGMIFYANYYTSTQSGSSLITALPFFSVAAASDDIPSITKNDISPEMTTFWEAWSFLNDQFYGEIPSNNVRVYGAIRGMVDTFDDQHTSFIDPVRAAISSENMKGSFEGIGATLRLDEEGRLIVADPMPGHPAFLAGLRPEDIILEIDGQSIRGRSLHETVLLIRGPANTEVKLTLLREGELEPITLRVVRAKIELEVVESKLLDSEVGLNIGYIRLTQFSGGASDKLARAIETLFDQGVESLIFDLRNNPGGLLSEAVNVSSLFIKNETIVREKLKGGEEKTFKAKGGKQVALDTPLVVLVNGGSASASEIVAGAMQDLGRATIVGAQTFGKGSVQLPHSLSDGSELRVTIAEWLTPTGRQIHGKGITPDIMVEMSVEDYDRDIDPQLEESINYLTNNR